MDTEVAHGGSVTLPQSSVDMIQPRRKSSNLSESSQIGDETADSCSTPHCELTGSGNLNLLQAALSSLSLTDKCALSLSLAPNTSPRASNLDESMESEISNVFMPGRSPEANDIDSMFDSQSVISESDKESLDVVMSMMGPHEIEKVESEVKVIQNNVRAWILRKNYTNLRDAARVLQTAWRVKKNPSDVHGTNRSGVLSPVNRKKRKTTEEYETEGITEAIPSSFRHTDTSGSYSTNSSDRVSSAAATLQAVTRGMLARKTFENAKRQGMASLIIQKTLVDWWSHNNKDYRSTHFTPRPHATTE